MKNKLSLLLTLIAILRLSVSAVAQMVAPGYPGPVYDGCVVPTLSISGTSINLCPGNNYTYTPGLYLPPGFTPVDFTWAPLTGIIPTSLATGPGVPPPLSITFSGTTTTYTLTVNSVGPNLINNGSFDVDPSGVTVYPGFTTQYQDYQCSSGNTQGHMKLGSWSGSGAYCLPPMPGGYDPTLDVFTHSGTSCFSCTNRMLNVRGATCIGHRSWMGFGSPCGSAGFWNNDHCAEADPGYFWGQNVNLCKGKTYRFTFWVRLMSACTGTNELPTLGVGLTSMNPDLYSAQSSYSFSTSSATILWGGPSGTPVGYTGCSTMWDMKTFTFTAATTGTFFIYMWDGNSSPTGNDFSIDDISLCRSEKTIQTITLNPIPHTEDIVVNPNDASGIYDGFPCAGTYPFTITSTPSTTVVYNIDGGPSTSHYMAGGIYNVPFTDVAGTTHTLTLQSITVAGCLIPLSITKTLSSTVGSEAWNSRDLKSRPH